MLVNYTNLHDRHKVFQVANDVMPDLNFSFFFSFQTKRRGCQVIIHASKLRKSSLQAQSLPSITRKPRLYTIHIDYCCSFVLFSSRETKGETLLIVAMDHENLYHHTALQAVPLTRKKSRDSCVQRDSVVTVCQCICKSLYAELYHGSCTLTNFDWIT